MEVRLLEVGSLKLDFRAYDFIRLRIFYLTSDSLVSLTSDFLNSDFSC